jgi:hypothetical protein
MGLVTPLRGDGFETIIKIGRVRRLVCLRQKLGTEHIPIAGLPKNAAGPLQCLVELAERAAVECWLVEQQERAETADRNAHLMHAFDAAG